MTSPTRMTFYAYSENPRVIQFCRTHRRSCWIRCDGSHITFFRMVL